MQRSFPALFLLLIICAPRAHAQAERWWSHVTALAHDSMRGRDTGSPEYRKAAEFLADHFRRAGAEPIGTKGFLQPVGFTMRGLDESKSSLTLIRDGREERLTLGEDAAFVLRAPLARQAEGPVVFAGYGLSLPEYGHDDLKGLDLRGKIVAVMSGMPKGIPGPVVSHSRSQSWETFRARGAIGMLTFAGSRTVDSAFARAARNRLAPQMTLSDASLDNQRGNQVSIQFNAARAEKLFAGAPQRFAAIAARADSGLPLPHFDLPVRIRSTAATTERTISSDNVAAVIRGSDPRLRDEYVVLSAHLDHVGVGRPVNGDSIYNGAMDNASGSALLIEMAYTLAQQKQSLKRSVILLAVTAEEKGLLGSRYFANHPTVPPGSIIANLNTDMFLPIIPFKKVMVNGLEESNLADDIRRAGKAVGVEVISDPEPEENRFVRSDQYSFILRGIPALSLKVGFDRNSPEHKTILEFRSQRYHLPADDVNQHVDRAAAEGFARLYAALVKEVANRPTRPSYNSDSYFKRFEGGKGRASSDDSSPAAAPTSLVMQARLDSVFSSFVRTNGPGCTVGTEWNGERVTRSYGMANLEYGVALTPTSVVESGSVAKQFTSAALVLLARQGKLSLDDDIRKHLPEVPDFGKSITIRQMLMHMSGLRDQWGLLSIEGNPPGAQVHTFQRIVDLVKRQRKLNFEPGSEYLYSNTGYALAAMIATRVAGKPFAQFSREALFEPLGMMQTRWRDDYRTIVRDRATAYAPNAGGWVQDMPFTMVHGNGGLLTTVDDLLAWNAALTTGRAPLTADVVRELETVGTLNDGAKIDYALGLTVTTYKGTREVSHGGSTAGYRTFLARWPDRGLSVAVLCNAANANPDRLAHTIADRTLGLPASEAAPGPAVAISEAELQPLAGTYRDRTNDQVATFVIQNGQLAARGGGGGIAPLTYLGGMRFWSDVAGDYRFERSGDSWRVVAFNNAWRRFERHTPPSDSVKVADYIGAYRSPELDVVIEMSEANGQLLLRRGFDSPLTLAPLYQDGFNVGGQTFRFSRDAKGRVTGFQIFAGRVRGLEFERVTPPTARKG